MSHDARFQADARWSTVDQRQLIPSRAAALEFICAATTVQTSLAPSLFHSHTWQAIAPASETHKRAGSRATNPLASRSDHCVRPSAPDQIFPLTLLPRGPTRYFVFRATASRNEPVGAVDRLTGSNRPPSWGRSSSSLPLRSSLSSLDGCDSRIRTYRDSRTYD
jgi:hypothetical protein